MEKYKTCGNCNSEKHISYYYAHKKSKDGYLSECKECVKKRVKENYNLVKGSPEWLEKERIRGREKYRRLGYKDKYKPNTEKKREIMAKYNKKYPEKQKAKNSTSNMKPKIEGNELHHWSYNEEHFKDVIELTVLEHKKAHRYMVYDPERKMYRRADNNILLDTKEAHIEFINSLKDKI